MYVFDRWPMKYNVAFENGRKPMQIIMKGWNSIKVEFIKVVLTKVEHK